MTFLVAAIFNPKHPIFYFITGRIPVVLILNDGRILRSSPGETQTNNLSLS